MISYLQISGEPCSQPGRQAITRQLQDGQDLLLEATKYGCLDDRTYRPRRHIVERCDDLMRQRMDQPPSLMELCRELRISRRTLQYSFKSETGTSPLHYLRSIRLNAVRRSVMRSPHRRLADIAADQGFFHESYFSHAYKRLFGELPSQTREKYDH